MFEGIDMAAIKSWLLSHRASLTLDTIFSMLSRIFVLSLSFLSSLPLTILPRFMRKDGLKPSKPPHVTSYLDALRGFAAIIVVNHHFFPYSATWLFKLPFVRVFYAGFGMVDVFFVISGYVLSYRMLKLMRTRRVASLMDSFASSVFRRYLRLYAAAAAASFITMVLSFLRLGTPGHQARTFHGQIWHWIFNVLRFSNPFVNLDGYWHDKVFKDDYLLVLWTIPIEFRGSLVVYLFCMGTCKLSTRARMSLCSLMILLSFYWTATFVALFLGGTFIADLSFIRHPERLDSSPPLPQNEDDIAPNYRQEKNDQKRQLEQRQQPEKQQPLAHRIFYITMFIIAIFLLGEPLTDLKTASYPWPQLDYLIPNKYRATPIKDHFWLSIGALMLVFALESCAILQTPFKWNFSQYLGQISFGIYVMHLPVLWCLWFAHLNPWRVKHLGKDMWTYAPMLVPFHIVILWSADLFCRIDSKIVGFGQWLQKRYFEW
jgi:peptidoglycan/LPS O-acetylase OafA/YrhL